MQLADGILRERAHESKTLGSLDNSKRIALDSGILETGDFQIHNARNGVQDGKANLEHSLTGRERAASQSYPWHSRLTSQGGTLSISSSRTCISISLAFTFRV